MSEGDMRDILSEICTVRPKWYYIGLQLNVPPYILETIKSEPTSDCLDKVIRYWLTHMNPRPTWGDLANALKKSTVGESRLAGEIERKFCYRERARAMSDGSKDAGERDNTPETRTCLGPFNFTINLYDCFGGRNRL